MDNKKQYYTNLTSNEKSIESKDGSKVLMDSNGNVLFTTARRPEYIDPLREDYYQGGIDLNPDEEGSYFFIGTEQIIIDQQGNTNQDTILEPEIVKPDQQEESFNNISSEEPEFGRYSTYSDDNGIELGTFIDLKYEEPVDTYNPPPPVKEDWVTTNWTATARASLLKNWPTNKTNIIAPPYYTPFNNLQKATLTRLANIELDIWNPYRIKQPLASYNRNLEGAYLNTRLGYERPYYTEITAILAKSFPKKDRFLYDITEYLELFTPPRSIKPNSLMGINTGYNPSWLQNTEYGKEMINKVKTKEELEKDYEKLYLSLLKYSGGSIDLVEKFTYVSPKFIAIADLIGKGAALDYIPDDGSTAWSAYFISWLISKVEYTFPRGEKGQSHYNYASPDKYKPLTWELFPLPYYGDKLNRTNDGRSVKVKLEIGDILIAPREGESTSSHGDMVYDIDLKNKKAYLIGGNVDDTVMITPVNIDENGFYSSEQPYRTANEKVSISTQTYITYLVALKKVR